MNKLVMYFFGLIVVTSTSYAASCYRTIYNNSNKAWTVEFAPDDGDVHFTKGITCSHPKNGPCKIFAYNKKVEIQYTSDHHHAKGTIFLTPDGNNSSATLLEYQSEDSFKFCPQIHTNQAAINKGIFVNVATNGDIEFKEAR